jgi:5'-3' exonuclease
MELPSEGIALIDADSIVFIAHWDSDNKTYDKPLEVIKQSIDSIISSILINTKASKYLGYIGYTKAQFRYDAYPEYKANRKDKEPLPFYKEAKQHMVDHWKFIPLHGIEADDVVNMMRIKFDNSFICAIDKDLLKLEGTHYNYKTNDWVTTSEQEADLYFWESMIIGDLVDNIKGLEGKGKAFATKLLANIDDVESLRTTVFEEYINQYGEYKGIEKFYQNYKCLKIMDGEYFSEEEPITLDVNNLVI